LTQREKDFIKLTDDFIKITADDKYFQLKSTLGQEVGYIEGYRPLKADTDKLKKIDDTYKGLNETSLRTKVEQTQDMSKKGDRVSSYDGVSTKPRVQSRREDVDVTLYNDTYSDVFQEYYNKTFDTIYDTPVKKEINAIISDKSFRDAIESS